MANSLDKNFRAAVLFQQHEPLQVLQLPRVTPSTGQVEVRMITASLCGAQWNEITGVKGPDKFLPHMMGHEGVGEVVSVGEGVQKVKKGDIVVLHWRKGSGHDCFGPKYQTEQGAIGSGSVTTFAEYTVVAENRVSPVEYDPDMRNVYPLVGCALSTSWGVLLKEVKARKEQSLFISGAGGLGLSIAFWAKLLEMERVVVFDRFESKRNQVERLDATFVSVARGESIGSISESFDIFIDTTGNVDNISAGFDRLKTNGKLVLVGQPRIGSVLTLNNPLKIFDGITIFSSQGGTFSPDDDLREILSMLNQHKDLARQLVSHTISLDDVNDGFRMMQDGEASRVVIDFEK